MIAAVNNELTHAHTHHTAQQPELHSEMNVLGWDAAALSCSVPSERAYVVWPPSDARVMYSHSAESSRFRQLVCVCIRHQLSNYTQKNLFQIIYILKIKR